MTIVLLVDAVDVAPLLDTSCRQSTNDESQCNQLMWTVWFYSSVIVGISLKLVHSVGWLRSISMLHFAVVSAGTGVASGRRGDPSLEQIVYRLNEYYLGSVVLLGVRFVYSACVGHIWCEAVCGSAMCSVRFVKLCWLVIIIRNI